MKVLLQKRKLDVKSATKITDILQNPSKSLRASSKYIYAPKHTIFLIKRANALMHKVAAQKTCDPFSEKSFTTFKPTKQTPKFNIYCKKV